MISQIPPQPRHFIDVSRSLSIPTGNTSGQESSKNVKPTIWLEWHTKKVSALAITSNCGASLVQGDFTKKNFFFCVDNEAHAVGPGFAFLSSPWGHPRKLMKPGRGPCQSRRISSAQGASGSVGPIQKSAYVPRKDGRHGVIPLFAA